MKGGAFSLVSEHTPHILSIFTFDSLITYYPPEAVQAASLPASILPLSQLSSRNDVPFFTEHDGSPIIEGTKQSPPLSNKSFSSFSSSDKPFATPNKDNVTQPKYLSLTPDHRRSSLALAPETPNDHKYGEKTPGNWPDLASESTPPSAEVEYSSTSKAAGKTTPTTTDNLADSHRKSKTEFNSLPSELLHMSLGITGGPDTGAQAHRKSSTEFKEVVVAEGK
ncbi:hypothetical protein CNYM01_04640 [Colletotrichum nymphaeae SA-01]|uniref:Uncharacterized protein n=1 Tax=Colletotrichum nymphaeae SA-01 TaxID=1460502 RepID=A0A135TFY8_9PEZI|nr:hypothetical protein CNYM01_04640 [Colletotrichum nymphaeae SA-01]